MSCQVDNFDLTELVIFGLIQIWDCALNGFILEPLHECLVDICDLRGLKATYPKHVFC